MSLCDYRWLLPALATAGLALAACAPTPVQPTSSLPIAVIKNDPSARQRPEQPVVSKVYQPVPQVEARWHDELPVEIIATGDVLDRIRASHDIADVDHPSVDAETDWYAQHGDYLGRVFGRSQRYLHFIVEELDRRDMPRELALLPVVESAFNPYAYSRSRASGLWQFIAPTGTRFGLTQNYWQDQRRDVVESTRAALDYLEYLHGVFQGDWLLAVAAYNYGSLNVMRAIERNRAAGLPTDFFSLPLPGETRAYVPKLLAINRVVRSPDAYGVALPPVPNAPYFRVVETGGPVDLRLAASLAGLDPEELHALNPQWNRWATDPQGPHRLLLPAAVAQGFEAQLAMTDPTERLRLNTHRVTKGQDLRKIARTYDVPVDVLRELNGLNGRAVRPGDELLVPATSATPLLTGLHTTPEPTHRVAQAETRRVHTVRKGDTLSSVARRYDLSVAKLARLNGLSAQSHLKPGQRLVVVEASEGAKAEQKLASAEPVPRKVTYKVRSGDTLSQVSQKFDVTVRQLQSWNRMGHKTALKPGQKLVVYVDARTEFGG